VQTSDFPNCITTAKATPDLKLKNKEEKKISQETGSRKYKLHFHVVLPSEKLYFFIKVFHEEKKNFNSGGKIDFSSCFGFSALS
jgi:hypothetical protein